MAEIYKVMNENCCSCQKLYITELNRNTELLVMEIKFIQLTCKWN